MEIILSIGLFFVYRLAADRILFSTSLPLGFRVPLVAAGLISSKTSFGSLSSHFAFARESLSAQTRNGLETNLSACSAYSI